MQCQRQGRMPIQGIQSFAYQRRRIPDPTGVCWLIRARIIVHFRHDRKPSSRHVAYTSLHFVLQPSVRSAVSWVLVNLWGSKVSAQIYTLLVLRCASSKFLFFGLSALLSINPSSCLFHQSIQVKNLTTPRRLSPELIRGLVPCILKVIALDGLLL